MSITLMRKGNAKEYIQFMRNSKLPFQLSCSNYTTRLKAGELSKTFVANMQSKRTFAAYAKIKSDLKDKPVPKINQDTLIYFQHDFKKDIYIDEVVNIDIRSAYATVLFNDGLISKETFAYLAKIKKHERLASVGMLASRKKNFEFVNGEPVSMEEVVSETSGFFFHAIKRTHELMNNLKKLCGNNYLFTWVDGIYFLPDPEAISKCLQELEQHNFEYKVENLTEFDVSIKQHKILVTFKKEGESKIFNLPSPTSEFKSIIVDSLISLNNQKAKQNEKSKIKVSAF
jgi:hypothetical protein